MKRNILPLIVLLLVAAGAGYWFYRHTHPAQSGMAMQMPPVAVSTAQARAETWRETIEVVGSLRAVQGVDVTTELAGIVRDIRFKSGDSVPAGAVLAQLDTSADQAQLEGYEAQLELAQLQLGRGEKLVRTQAMAQAALDQARAQVKQAQANVAYQRAIIQKKTIRAPFAGQLGIRMVDLGQYLAPGTPIVTLQALDPIRVEFLVPQQKLDRLRDGQPIAVTVDTYPGAHFAGKITAISSRADVQTRNFPVEGTLANPDGRLRPGMFARVAVEMPAERQVVTIAQTAVNFSPYGDSVFVVTPAAPSAQGQAPGAAAAATPPGPGGAPALVAHQRFVKLGDTRGDQIAVLDGVKGGEVVVTSGQFKLRDGAPVIVNNAIQPPSNPAPTPENS